MMIEARHIVKRYGDLEVLRGVDLDIAQGEIVSIVGPSGAGKTTLLQILGTLDAPQEGEVRYDGKDVLTLRDR
jgi:lipoprotein-releasing system ATP-binding protein